LPRACIIIAPLAARPSVRAQRFAWRLPRGAARPNTLNMTAEIPNLAVTRLCTEDEIRQLVHAFYARVRQDDLIGPIFNTHVDDWDHHLAKLADFWSSILLRTGRYSGTPMSRHAALPGLRPELFQRWLALFRETADEQPNRAMAERACEMAQRIAQSLWMGYQISRSPDAIPAELPNG
jgi:hemoglobin